MRRIGELDDARQAATLADVLFGDGIDTDARHSDSGTELWVRDDARLAEARGILDAFGEDPGSAEMRARAAKGVERRKATSKKDAHYQRRMALAKREAAGADGRGWITWFLLACSVAVALVTNLGQDSMRLPFLFLTLYPAQAGLPEVMSGQVWRLVTPIIVHFGVIHLLFNMTMWWRFAQRVEVYKGGIYFAVFVVVAAVFSNLTQFGWQLLVAPYRPALVGGMSGVLYALFGFIWFKGRIDPASKLSIDDQNRNLLLGWLVLCMTGVFGNVANAAHVGGLVVGIAWAYIDVAWFRFQKGR